MVARWPLSGVYREAEDSSVFEIDVFDTVMRDIKHITTGTPADKLNDHPSGRTMASGLPIPRNRPKAPIRISLWRKLRPARVPCSLRTRANSFTTPTIFARRQEAADHF